MNEFTLFDKYLSEDEETSFRAFVFKTVIESRIAEGSMVSPIFIQLAEKYIRNEISLDEWNFMVDSYLQEADSLLERKNPKEN